MSVVSLARSESVSASRLVPTCAYTLSSYADKFEKVDILKCHRQGLTGGYFECAVRSYVEREMRERPRERERGGREREREPEHTTRQ